MGKIKVEFFGPAKKFTSNKEFDMVEISNDSADLSEVFQSLQLSYGLEFVRYIISCCGVVINFDYIDLGSREAASDLTQDNCSKILVEIFTGHRVGIEDVVVIVPPVSSG